MSKPANSRPSTEASSSNLYDTYIRGKELYYLMAFVCLGCYITFSDFINFKKLFLFKDIGSDTINMGYPLLVNYSEYLKTEGVPGWSFSQGMGQNMFPLWLGDFFTNFVMLFSKETIPKVIVFMEILKIFLCATIFFKFLKELKVSGFAALLGGLLYAFSGYVILGGTWAIFSTEAVYVAVMLLGIERWLNSGKWFLFLLGITLLGFLQPFYLFTYTLFLIGYIIVRYNDLHEGNWKGFLLFSLKTVGVATLAVAITSYQLLPDVLMLLESPRVAGEAGLSAQLKAQPMFALADEVLRFTTTFRAFGSDLLGTGSNFKGWQNYLEAPLFYCGILNLVAFPHVFSTLNKKQKWFYGVLTGLYVLPILFPYFRYAFWAFSGDYFRTFSLVIVVWMLIYSIRAVSYIEQKGVINKIVLAVTGLFLLFLLYSPATQFNSAVEGGARSFAAFLVVAYTGLLFLLTNTSGMKHIAKLGLILLCVIEVCVVSRKGINKRDAMRKTELTDKVGYNDYTMDAMAYLKQNDKTFFRVQKDYSSGLAIHSSINDAKAQGFYGTSSYHSFNQINYIRFLGGLNIIDVKDENSTRWAKGLSERPLVFSVASGKYWLSKRPDNYLQGFGYDSIAKFGDVKVFKNRYSLPFGFAYKQVMMLSAFKTLNNLQKDLFLLKGCVIDDEDKAAFTELAAFNLSDTTKQFSFEEYGRLVSGLRKDSLAISDFKENKISGTMNTDSTRVLFLSIPFDQGWSAKVDGQEAKLYRVNIGLTGLIIKKGNHKVEFSFEPRLKGKGALVSIMAILLVLALLALQYMRAKKSKSPDTPAS